jgi:polyphosphate kinase
MFAGVQMDDKDFRRPELFLNRQLSLLEFNARVLEQARDTRIPLLERLRFLCISSTNLDEFFEIRVSGLKQASELGSTQVGADNRTPQEVLRLVSQRAHQLVEEQYRVLNEVLIPDLAKEHIRFIRRGEWNAAQQAWVREYFEDALLPVLSPLGLDPAHPFPRILNKSLNFIVQLEGKDAFGRNSGLAIVQAPRALPRLIRLSPENGSGSSDFVFLSSVIHAHVEICSRACPSRAATSSASLETATCTWTRRKWMICWSPWRVNCSHGATAMRCGWRSRQTVRPGSPGSCWKSSSWTMTICTRSTAR